MLGNTLKKLLYTMAICCCVEGVYSDVLEAPKNCGIEDQCGIGGDNQDLCFLLSIYICDIECIGLHLGHGVSVDYRFQLPNEELTALLLSAGVGHERCVAFLLKNNATVDFQQSDTGATALYVAAHRGYLNIISLLLKYGADINQQTVGGSSALMVASAEGHKDCVERLLANGADINHQQVDGSTALIFASQEGHKDCVKLLLANGADVNQQAVDGITALMMATRKGHKGCVDLLLANGADINHQVDNGLTALIVASQKGHKGCVDLLLANGADINQQAFDGATALMLASQEGRKDCVDLLLANGADINQQAVNGASALGIASSQGHKGCVAVLLANGADVNHKACGGSFPLHISSYRGHKAVVALLLEYNADEDIQFIVNENLTYIDYEDGAYLNGTTSLEVAIGEGHAEVAILLSGGSLMSCCSSSVNEWLESWDNDAIGVALECCLKRPLREYGAVTGLSVVSMLALAGGYRLYSSGYSSKKTATGKKRGKSQKANLKGSYDVNRPAISPDASSMVVSHEPQNAAGGVTEERNLNSVALDALGEIVQSYSHIRGILNTNETEALINALNSFITSHQIAMVFTIPPNSGNTRTGLERLLQKAGWTKKTISNYGDTDNIKKYFKKYLEDK